MKGYLRNIVAGMLLSLPVYAQLQTFKFDGRMREYSLHIPNSLPDGAPLVFVLHGYGGTATGIESYTGMNQVADSNNFAVVYPQGSVAQDGSNFWNAGYSFHANETVDDVAFLKALALHLQAVYSLSSQKTYSTGHSNGGDMSYVLGCQASDIFKAIAPVAGTMMKWLYDSCEPIGGMPVLEIHGNADPITYWDGDINDNQGYGPYMSVMATFNFWINFNGATGYVRNELADTHPNDGSRVISEKYVSGITGIPIWLYTIVDGGHGWPGTPGNNLDINASEIIWEFFTNVPVANILGITDDEPQTSRIFQLQSNYPNPFNPNTLIQYQLAGESIIRLSIHDIHGRELKELVSGTQAEGEHHIVWDGSDYPSGIYFARVTSSGASQTIKMVLLK